VTSNDPGRPQAVIDGLLAEPELRNRFMVEESSDILAIHEANGTLRWISAAVERVLGWTPDQRLSLDLDLIHGDDMTAIGAVRQELAQGKASGTARIRLKHVDGSFRWADSTARAVRAEDGSIQALVVITRDVHDQVTAERSLAEAEQRYRLIAENAGDVVFLTTDQGEISWISPSATDLLGWAPAEIEGRLARSLVHPDDLDEVVAGMSAIRSGAAQATGRSRVLTADGAYRWFSWLQRGVSQASGAEALHVTTMRDAQVEVKAEEALASSLAFYRLLAENGSDVVVLLGSGGVIDWVSPSATRTFGWDPDRLVGTQDVDFIHPDDLERFADEAARQEDMNVAATLTLRLRCGDGRYLWIEAAWQVTGEDGRRHARVVRLRDIDAEVRANEELARSEEKFRLMAENASDVVLLLREEAVEWISPSLQDALGWAPAEWIGGTAIDFVHPDDMALQVGIQDRLIRGEPVLYRLRIRAKDGTFRWCEVHARSYGDANTAHAGIVASFRIIDTEVGAQEALSRSEELFRTAMDSAPTGMAVIDLDRRFLEVNPALCLMLGRDEGWLLQHRMADVIDPEDDALDLRMRASVLSGHQPSLTHEKRMIRGDGSMLWVEHSIGLLRDDEGIPRGYVSQFVNVTEAREAREELRFMATHDPMTRLINRPELLTRMDRLLSHSPRTGTQMATLFIDLDNLKRINDTYGHSVGDDVIVAVSERLREQVRSGDLVARLGGDEFVVLLPAIHTIADAERIAGKLLAAVGEPLAIESHTLTVTASIGVALASSGDDPDRILEFADRALYRAKRNGRARTVSYDSRLFGVPEPHGPAHG
jgi:diguanylate cyclase (GGDEF)-like protein/PAS domain S-box-containing protein